MRIFTPFTLLFCLATTAVAQDRPNTILVMDGSGSMWGQIDGVAKITIAQDVVTQLLDTLPADERLGLTVYGHRARGSCTDIETIVAPDQGTRDAIAAAVRGIKPLGKTPMTDAIIAAAEALRYTEDSATVILVSDGVETCNPDPCAAARLLEETGVDFTAHVIGFDVGGDPDAIAQMQCIADETGGQFLSAANAGELAAALTTVVEEPAPVFAEVTLQAIVGDVTGPLVADPIMWSLTPDSATDLTDAQSNPVTVTLAADDYGVTARRVADGMALQADFIVETSDAITVTVILPAPEVSATVSAPATAPLGSTVDVTWTGPNGAGDYIGIGKTGAAGADQWENFAYTETGSPAALLVPTTPGAYDIAYFLGDSRTIVTSVPITVTEVTATLTAPDTATAGSIIGVDWTGPDYASDYVGVGAVGAEGANAWENFFYTENGTPGDLVLPTDPGDYLITYFLGQDRSMLASVPLTVTDVVASLTAPDSAIAGATIAIEWTGPNYPSDYIGIGKTGAEGSNAWENFFYTENGNPGDLVIPTDPGEYTITYFVGQDRSALASVPITVSELSATLRLPATAVAGDTITVDWTGPDYASDYIGIGQADATGSNLWENFSYTETGAPASLMVPSAPGSYVVSYFLGQDRSILATVPIEVTAVTATLAAPETAVAGSTITVDWSGPDYASDYVGIGTADATGSAQWDNFFYTENAADGGALLVPTTPGDYLIGYFMGQDRSRLTTVPLTVTPIERVQILAEDAAPAGSDLIIGWDGPAYQDDYIGIGKVGASGSAQWEVFTYVGDENPVTLTLPETPGDYLITYFLQQDRSALMARPLTIE